MKFNQNPTVFYFSAYDDGYHNYEGPHYIGLLGRPYFCVGRVDISARRAVIYYYSSTRSLRLR